MFCPQCGTQLPDGTKFCNNCGFDLTSAQAHQGHSTSNSPYAQAQGTIPPQPQASTNPQYAQPQYAQQGAPADPYAQAAPQQPYGQQALPGQQPYGNPYGGQPQGNPYPGAHSYPNNSSFDLNAILAAVVWPKEMPPVAELFQDYNHGIVQYAESQGLGMKWYKFNAWRGWAYLMAVFGVIGALGIIFGSQYGSSSGYIYNLYPALRIWNILYALVSLAMVCLQLYSRRLYVQFRKGAPETRLVVYAVNACAGVINSVITSLLTGQGFILSLISNVIGLAIGLAIVYVVWKSYYGKRAHLFVN